MPAPVLCTPPQPTEPPYQQTPRCSFAQRLTTPPTRRLSTPNPERGSSSSKTPLSSRRRRITSSTTVRRQLIPAGPSRTTAVSSSELDPASPDQGDTNLDEDLTDPEFFIKLFSRIDGPIVHADTELRESLLQKLERYLLKVNLYQENTASMPGSSKDKKSGPSNVNFAEAALVVQGSTRIYGKKVDLLFNAAVQLFRLLSTPFEEQEEEEGGEDAGPEDTPKNAKTSKRLRLGIENRDLAEDIALVDGMKEGGRIEQKKNSRPRFSELVKNLSSMPPRGSVRFLPPNIPRLVRKTKALGINDKEVEKINSRRVPQYGQGMEARGFIDEYRLNEVIRKPDFLLVEHFVPLDNKSVEVEHAQSGKALHPCHCDSGIDSCPSSVYNPVECSDSIIWEGSSIGACGETDMLSCADDGFISEGVHEEGISELGEESEADICKDGDVDGTSKESDPKATETESSEVETADTELGIVEGDHSGTESSGVFSEHGPVGELQMANLMEDERVTEPNTEAVNQMEDERVTEPNTEAVNQMEDARVPELHAGPNKEAEESNVKGRKCNSFPPAVNVTPSASKLKEVEFTPTPRRNKRKLKNFKLPCKLSLLLPEKKKKATRGSKVAELWRPSQSPCSSASSNYPMSPASFAPASPDPHSLSQLMLQDEDHHEDLGNLSESDNEGEYFDPPTDGQPQVNYWIQNHQKDLMSADQPTTLSDQVAQWQELIMPRLEANLCFGPYSHLRYAPVLMELVARRGWPPPEPQYQCRSDQTDGCEDLSDSEDEFALDQAPAQKNCSSTLEDISRAHRIPYDRDFMDPEEADIKFKGDRFFGFQTPKRLKRRGVALVEESLSEEAGGGHLFNSLARTYHWGLTEEELRVVNAEKRMREWTSEKRDWLQSKVRANRLQRNWDEWAEENDNIETNTELDVHLPSAVVSGSQLTEPVLFTTVFSGFRKEEVSRLLFTALHLTSQGVVEISSEPGVINSMKLSFVTDDR